MKRGDKPETQLPQPVFVDPRVATSNPQAAAYARQLEERRYAEQRGGGPTPPIPPLNAPHQAGMTMADQAAAYRFPREATQAAEPQTIFTPDAASSAAQRMHAHQSHPGILASDVLPQAAMQDPMFREGHGSMYAVNQHPSLAQKYGVIRNGKPIPGQQLQTGRPGLSPKTVEGLAAVQAFQQQRAAIESGEAAAQKASDASPAAQAARLANPSRSEDVKPVSEEDKRAAEEAVKNMDDFDFNAFREIMMKDLLNNDEQRQIVESRLQPLDLAELIMKGRITQRVPIIPERYEPVFQSMTGEEELALKRLLMQERKNIEAPDRYLLDKFQLMTVACGLNSINKIPLPDHLDKEGNFDDEGFWRKFNRVLKLPFHMLASIGVHYYWFDVRVRKLFVAEKIKNG